ncbi:MAG: 6,7-dimethyl-8-ribityllumazine synthase, partial [Bacteroidetes bacterium]|nr:6,7-dimethyl-8-ribityllumazine synthase [Bacteroidota bacterium]
MMAKNKNLSLHDPDVTLDGTELKIGVVTARWNKEVTEKLREGCISTLLEYSVAKDDISELFVPGSYELPQGARILLTKHRKIDALVCLGCVIKGETDHNDYINRAVSTGLMQLGLTSGVPCIFGVLTPSSMEQALDRAGGSHGNKGVEAAATAIQMAKLSQKHGLP